MRRISRLEGILVAAAGIVLVEMTIMTEVETDDLTADPNLLYDEAPVSPTCSGFAFHSAERLR